MSPAPADSPRLRAPLANDSHRSIALPDIKTSRTRPRNIALKASPSAQPQSTTPPSAGFSQSELEFVAAMNAYKQSSGRLFPTWSEVLEVLKSLGYQKPDSSNSTQWG